MKKLLTIALMLAMASCTEKTITRNWGGNDTIYIDKGQKCVMLTWKENGLWILTEPMDSDYIPKQKTFYEDSEFGVLEGKVIIIERK